MSSIYGENLKLSIFGQSHGSAIGMVLDGIPAGLPVDLDALQKAVSIGCDYRGLIEVVGLEDGVCIICNEEGKLLGLANWCKNSPGDCFWPVGRSMDCKLHPKWVRDAIHNKECPNKIPRGSVL